MTERHDNARPARRKRDGMGDRQRKRPQGQGARAPSGNGRALSPCPPGLTRDNLQAISAPYNFVPLADWVHVPEWAGYVSHDWPFEDGYSGEIHYRLIAESPILVGGAQDQRERSDAPHTEVHPFRLPDGRHAVPGSSIKGMLRAVVEIAGFGRMRMVDDARPGLRDISGRHVKSTYTERVRNRVKAGFLRLRKDGGCEIRPARMARLPHKVLEKAFGVERAMFEKGQTVADKYRTWRERCTARGWRPDTIRFELEGNDVRRVVADGGIEGFPVFTGQVSDSRERAGKKRDFVFYGVDEAHPIPVPDDTWRDFLHVHGDDAPADSGMPWPGHWKPQFREGKCVPVFYLVDDDRLRIGLAYMPKLAGDFGVHDAIDHVCAEHLRTPPGPDRYDLADLLFGAVNGSEQQDALRGRVTFETATARDAPQPLPAQDTILNGPKPGYFPSYLRQQTDGSTRHLRGGDDAQYATYVKSRDNPKPRIRGFKRYPARPGEMTRVQELTADQKGNLRVQTRLHPLPPGTAFEGRIVFHNLKPEELGALLWAITWGGDEGLRHGLGMGKPFGFGQVRFLIDPARSRLVPNDPRDPEAALDDARQQALLERFTSHMEAAAAEHGGWCESAQIRNLLAMADPESPAGLPAGMELRHMHLMRCEDNGHTKTINEFLWAKQKTPALVLADYAVASGWPSEGTRRRWREKASEGLADDIESSRLHPWLQEQLSRVLEESHATDIAGLMRHNNLFRAWKAIEDPALKKDVFLAIREFWSEHGWWDQPESKSMRKLRNQYQREGDKL